jgi:hypothetical protein
MNTPKTEWDLFLSELPEDLRAAIEEGVTSIELPGKDHPIFEILRQSFGEYFAQIESEESPDEESDETGESEAPKCVEVKINASNTDTDLSQQVQGCLELMNLTSQSMNKTHGLMMEASGQIKANCDKTVDHVQRMVSSVQLSLDPSVQRLEACFNKINLWRQWTPWITSGVATLLITTTLFFWGYHKAVNLAYDRAETKFAKIEGITKANITTLKELGKIGVTATLVPDAQNEQYFLNLTNVREFTGKSDIPGGKALIFKP